MIIPLTGWLYSSATGVQVVYAGALALPDLVPKDKALAEALRLVHVSLNSLLVAMVCVHVAAALKHHFVDHDGLLAMGVNVDGVYPWPGDTELRRTAEPFPVSPRHYATPPTGWQRYWEGQKQQDHE